MTNPVETENVYKGDVLDLLPDYNRLPVRIVIALHHLQDALQRRVRRELSSGKPSVVLVDAPTEAWTTALAEAAGRLYPKARILTGVRKKPTELTLPPASGPIFAISDNRQTLPSAAVAGADIAIKIWPSPRAIERALRTIYGRSARVRRSDLAGLNLPDIEFSLRPKGTAAAAVARMRRASRTRSTVEFDVTTPELSQLVGYGAALDRVRDIAEEVAAAQTHSNLRLPSFLLYGRPGVGKTLLVRAFARSVELPLVVSAVGDWFQGDGYLGDVIKAARAVFDQACAAAPAILFIDEVDSIPDRSKLSGRGRDWWTPVITSVLLNIDRVREQGAGVILVGATNHIDHLDRALIRPGRFDRLIEIQGPQTIDETADVFRACLRADLSGVDLRPVALLTDRPSGAAIVDWVAQARAAAKAAGRPIALTDLVTVVAPPETRDLSELRATALHEAAHAVVGIALGVKIQAVSIVRKAEASGMTTLAPPSIVSRVELEAHIVATLAGRAADIVYGGGPTSGAMTDLAASTRLVCLAHGVLGLGDKLAVRATFDAPTTALSFDHDFRNLVEGELRRLMDEALSMVRAHSVAIESLASRLLKQRVITGADVAECQSALNFDPLSASNVDPLELAARCRSRRRGAGRGCAASAGSTSSGLGSETALRLGS